MRPIPYLSRERRRTELERLAEDHVLGVPPSSAALQVLVTAFASDLLETSAVLARWEDFLGEYRRWQAAEAGDPLWRDLQPGLAEQDMTAALNDLLDGTDTYRGDRR
jgi:hypothetical protein